MVVPEKVLLPLTNKCYASMLGIQELQAGKSLRAARTAQVYKDTKAYQDARIHRCKGARHGLGYNYASVKVQGKKGRSLPVQECQEVLGSQECNICQILSIIAETVVGCPPSLRAETYFASILTRKIRRTSIQCTSDPRTRRRR